MMQSYDYQLYHLQRTNMNWFIFFFYHCRLLFVCNRIKNDRFQGNVKCLVWFWWVEVQITEQSQPMSNRKKHPHILDWINFRIKAQNSKRNTLIQSWLPLFYRSFMNVARERERERQKVKSFFHLNNTFAAVYISITETFTQLRLSWQKVKTNIESSYENNAINSMKWIILSTARAEE